MRLTPAIDMSAVPHRDDLVSTAPLRQLIDQDGRSKQELGWRYAERYGLRMVSGQRLIRRVFTQSAVSYRVADNLCCLFGVVGLVEAS